MAQILFHHSPFNIIYVTNIISEFQVTSPSLTSEVIGMPPIMTPTYAKEFQKVIETAARGRQIFTVQVFKYLVFHSN